MIGLWQVYANAYLYVVGAAMLAGFGIPLLISPVGWARLFRWVTSPGYLIPFLGRSLGAVISTLALFAFRVARAPAMQPFFFKLMLWIIAAMLLLHIYGALRRVQPITETVEILLWTILFVVTLGFYPS
ncbi:MAG: hypothetical protein M1281_10495 [Chloroflexi bacterium]|nr:hypothetical protein [Chloroflexota bacterium]